MKFPLLPLVTLFPVLLVAQLPFDTLEHIHSDTVFFDFGKYERRPATDSTLDELTARFPGIEGLSVYITAHTDSIGSLENNQKLSLNRANAVKSYLVEKGWPGSNMLVRVFGEKEPVTENTSEEGRQRNRRATIDLFRPVPLVRFSGQVRDQETGSGMQADIVIRTKTWQDSIQTDSAGRFSYPVPGNTVLGVDIFVPGYFFDTQMLKADQSAPQSDLTFDLKPLREGESVDIKNLYFVGNQAVLLERSEPELPKILRMMELNPGLKIEIAGHVNHPNRPPLTEDSWEYGLSQRRAKLVYDYLIDNSVAPDRLSYKGYGNWEMRYPKARSEKEQELNRRVEIRVLETGKQLGKLGKDGY